MNGPLVKFLSAPAIVIIIYYEWIYCLRKWINGINVDLNWKWNVGIFCRRVGNADDFLVVSTIIRVFILFLQILSIRGETFFHKAVWKYSGERSKPFCRVTHITCVGLLATSALSFKAKVDSFACMLHRLHGTGSSDSPLWQLKTSYFFGLGSRHQQVVLTLVVGTRRCTRMRHTIPKERDGNLPVHSEISAMSPLNSFTSEASGEH